MAGSEAPHGRKDSTQAETSRGRRPRLTGSRVGAARCPRPGQRHRGAAYVVAGALFIATLSSAEAQPPEAPPLDQLVRDLQSRYDTVRDFSADFEHRYTGGVLSISLVEHGTVLIKKPGKMRWSYATAEEKLYVSDGEMFYSYFPLDRQVIVTEVPPDDRASTAALFLAGRGNLLEDFDASYEDTPASPDAWAIRLTPRVADADYDWLVVTVDRRSLSITGLSTSDFQGGRSTYIFTQLEENQDLPDSAFEFTIPDNIDVVSDDPLLR